LTTDLPQDSRFDWKGALLIVPALTAFMALLNDGHAWGLVSPLFIGCALLAIILLTLFVTTERRAPAPLIDLQLFRRAAFVGGNIAGLMSYATLFGLMFLMPFMFVRAYGDSALAAGLRLTVVPLMLGAIAPLGGALYDRLGPRLLTVSGMLICVAGLVLLFVAMDGSPDSLLLVMLAMGIFGLGLGLFISPNNSAIMGDAPAELTGEAGGLLNVMRSLGTSVGIAAASALLSWRLVTLTGSGHNTLDVPRDHLLAAGRDVILLLVGFAIVAGAVSLLRNPSKSGASHEPVPESG
jgi:MFS family permease